MGLEHGGLIQCELLQLKEKISLLQTFLGQFHLPTDCDLAVAAAFKDLLNRIDRIASFLSGERKNDSLS
jgi:hypothetical protein